MFTVPAPGPELNSHAMNLRMWTYDLAREQAPTLDHLFQLAMLTQEAGYDSLGLYLEHRFAYPSVPWATGRGCVTPEMIRRLQSEFPSLRIVPFINLLGHFEGFLYSEEGRGFREEVFNGLQASPVVDEFVELCRKIIDDTVAIFESELVHIGGDETAQLGVSARSQARIRELTGGDESLDGKALLYGHHFGPLAQYVQEKGLKVGVWGDMFVEHPSALDHLPADTLIFDWQYFNGVAESSKLFTERGFKVVGCPAIQTYNAVWCHLTETEKNVREVTQDVVDGGLEGVCVTTWECALLGAYYTIFPAIRGCGAILNGDQTPLLDHFTHSREWAKLMSDDLAALGGTFGPSKIRSSLKVRLLLQSNPFLAWMHHAEEFAEGDRGQRAVEIAERALHVAPTEAEQGVSVFLRACVEFVALAEAARQEYAAGRPEAAIAKLAITRQLFSDLSTVAKRNHQRIGGSLADLERCRIAKEHVERVMVRIRQFGDRSLGYLPSWETITHPKFVPHDQANWWLINKWANQ